MNHLFGKEQMKQFIDGNQIRTAGDIHRALKDMFAETLQAMLEAEMDQKSWSELLSLDQ